MMNRRVDACMIDGIEVLANVFSGQVPEGKAHAWLLVLFVSSNTCNM